MAEAEEEGDAVLDQDLLGQLLTLLPAGLHVVGQHLLRGGATYQGHGATNLEGPLRPEGSVTQGLVPQAAPDEVEECRQEPGVGDPGEGVPARLHQLPGQLHAVGLGDHLEGISLHYPLPTKLPAQTHFACS